MLLYEYNCKGCGKKFEVRQKFADEPLTVHESCGGEVERLISAPSLHFKGTGFYVTDYGKNGQLPSASAGDSNGHSESKNGTKADSKTETKSESKSEAKSETKSESKSESKPAPANP